MAHIPNPSGAPGIRGLLEYRPETGGPLSALAEALLRGPSPLTPAERELIAAYVSTRNSCRYCAGSHGAAARHLGDPALVDAVLADADTAPISPKLRALLAIAESVRAAVAPVADELVAAARAAGADDVAIHDAALVAAAFCMYNRYVDGLATALPPDGAFDAIGARLASSGYVAPPNR